jgi:hypothetical protein
VDIEHLDEIYAVRESAYEGLRSGRFVGDTGLMVCRFVVLPSFENPVAWEVRSLPIPGQPPRPRLFRSCWRMDVDLDALGSPVERLRHPRPYRPTIEAGSVPIGAPELEALIQRLRGTPIPLAVVDPPGGVDGTTYELEVARYFCNARITWWVRLPQEWTALGPVVDAMTSLFESSWRDA